MINLRVFETPDQTLLIEVSSPQLRMTRALFVPASFNAEDFAEFPPSDLLKVRLHGELLHVFFMDVTSLTRAMVYEDCKVIGALPETDSIDILNNILDILAFA